MAVSPAVRVGIIVFIAAAALGAVAWFLTEYNLRVAGYPLTVVFDDSMGLIEGSTVTMAGVKVGRVETITLDKEHRAVVRMKINRRYRVPRGSTFVLRVGLLVGEKTVDIVPNREAEGNLPPGARAVGQVPVRIEDILPQTKQLVANLTEASESLRNILADKEFEEHIKRSLANVEMATARLDRTMCAIEGTVTGQQDEVRAIVSNVQVASAGLRDLMGELGRFAKEGRLQESLGETLASAQRAAASLDRTAASLEQLVTAPGFQEDIRQTAAEARAAAKEARDVIGRFGRIFGRGPRLKPGIPTRQTSLEGVLRPDDGRFRATLSATIPLQGDGFLNVGMYDVGAGNKLIVQPGQALNARSDLRYGIYASRLGLGLDYALSGRSFASFNLYDPYEPRLDVQAAYNLTDDVGVLLGVDDAFDDSKFTLGVRLTK
ncbi:MAG TPA: MlaD family protein [Armatimonadota bacterium]|nr:MlaD family protein [Armatimonadota bacterium]